ncbi:hypothetical protein [Rhodoferax mekongensis]|uniref:DUF4398 domain-containing protein n=1 Tax=Rhodoferax mekongensis TaxID=3068341 RepID=A0ABZ0AVB3_9BURK|nr:hypothetical protein [Rhodoferax sp. TBRC 17307]WNO03387.1 hypothetical protein RAN89_10650 [Rhodoferax sp. TBRC 17307]
MTRSLSLKSIAAGLACSSILMACSIASDPIEGAGKALGAKNFSEAYSLAQTATQKAEKDYRGYFLLSQAAAQLGKKNEGLVALEKAIDAGLKDDQEIASNANLAPLRDMSAYTTLMKTKFPDRNAEPTVGSVLEPAAPAEAQSGVSITEENGKQVVRAGGVVISVDK